MSFFICPLSTQPAFSDLHFDKMGVYTKLADEIQEVDVIIAGGEWLPTPLPEPPTLAPGRVPGRPGMTSADNTLQAARRHASSLRGWPRLTPR